MIQYIRDGLRPVHPGTDSYPGTIGLSLTEHGHVLRTKGNVAMSILCKVGLHKWNGCECVRCFAKRDQQHDWNGCTCRRCNTRRDSGHNIVEYKCTICGHVEPHPHRWCDCRCSICGAPNPKVIEQAVNTLCAVPDFASAKEAEMILEVGASLNAKVGSKGLDITLLQIKARRGRFHAVNVFLIWEREHWVSYAGVYRQLKG